MKRFLCCLLCCLLLFCVALPAQGLPMADFIRPFTQEALLSALYEADISALRQAISLKLISCEELTAYYLERIEAYNEPYNCFITICGDALEVARQRDAQLAQGEDSGLLFGIPIVIKDNMDMAGYLTTNGLEKSESPTADTNAWVISRLLEEGAVIIAKTNMSTEAEDARVSYSQAVGTTRNAYNTLLASGGSSGGSAVATSLNFAAAALGTDTNSSLRIPAVLNGCVTLRSTFDLISRDGIAPLNRTRDVPGAITRSVYDLALLMDVLTEHTYQYTENLNAQGLEGKRLGILSELTWAQDEDADPEVAAAFDRAVEELGQCGAEVITVSMPKLIQLATSSLASNAQSRKDAVYQEFQHLMADKDLDALIFPTYASTPLRHGTDENGTNWDPWAQPFLNNCIYLSPCAQIPEISVIIGYHSLGAGIGMEIVADKNCEQLLLDMAYAYTLRFDHRQAPTGAPDAYTQANAGTLKCLTALLLSAAEAPNAPTISPTVIPATIPTTASTTAPTEPETPDPTIEDTVPATQAPASTPPTPPEGSFWIWPLLLGIMVLAGTGAVIRHSRMERAARRRKRQQRREEIAARVRQTSTKSEQNSDPLP